MKPNPTMAIIDQLNHDALAFASDLESWKVEHEFVESVLVPAELAYQRAINHCLLYETLGNGMDRDVQAGRLSASDAAYYKGLAGEFAIGLVKVIQRFETALKAADIESYETSIDFDKLSRAWKGLLAWGEANQLEATPEDAAAMQAHSKASEEMLSGLFDS